MGHPRGLGRLDQTFDQEFSACASKPGAALTVPNCTRHPAGIIAQQEVNGFNHVLRRANPDNRMKAVAWCKDFVTCLERKIALDSPPEEIP